MDTRKSRQTTPTPADTRPRAETVMHAETLANAMLLVLRELSTQPQEAAGGIPKPPPRPPPAHAGLAAPDTSTTAMRQVLREASTQPEKLAFTIPEAVKASGIGRSSLYKAIKNKTLTIKKNGKHTLILRTDLVRFLEDL